MGHDADGQANGRHGVHCDGEDVHEEADHLEGDHFGRFSQLFRVKPRVLNCRHDELMTS